MSLKVAVLAGCLALYFGAEPAQARQGGAADVRSLAIDTTRALLIGQQSGASQYEFSGINGALRVGGGHIVVANCGSSELRRYDRSGTYVGSFGREGGGPGEFRMLTWVFRAGADSLAVWDRTQRRLTVIDAELRGARYATIEPSWEPVGFWDPETVIAFAIDRTPPANLGVRGALVRHPVHVASITVATGAVDTIATLGGPELWLWPRGSSIARSGYRSFSIAVAGEFLAVGSQDSNEFLTYRGATSEPHPTVTTTAPVPTTEAFKDWAGGRRRAQFDWPSQLPAYGAFRPSADGGVWVRDPVGLEGASSIWTLYQLDEPTARVALPIRFIPLDFGARWVLGVTADELDVEYIRLLPLVESHALVPDTSGDEGLLLFLGPRPACGVHAPFR